ncbi:MAG: O-methyltransferase [Bacteroidales bacterium]|nr:O-methyltransferase [Bacteroidales bacterium]
MKNSPDSLFISPLLEAYAENNSSPEPALLVQLRRETHLRSHMPQMLSGPIQGGLLRFISRMIQPVCILEIGTFTGYSALCLVDGLRDGGKLHTIEINPEMVEFAGRYFKEAGVSESIIQHTGDALSIIPGIPGPFDLVFIDADKENYLHYLELVLDKMSPGGWILADNTLWYGRVIEENAEKDRETAGIMAFNAFVASADELDCLLLPVRDGLTLIRKR